MNFTYEKKKLIADNYLFNLAGLSWDDLPDINSLHDYETIPDIIEACKERIDDDMPFSFSEIL